MSRGLEAEQFKLFIQVACFFPSFSCILAVPSLPAIAVTAMSLSASLVTARQHKCTVTCGPPSSPQINLNWQISQHLGCHLSTESASFVFKALGDQEEFCYKSEAKWTPKRCIGVTKYLFQEKWGVCIPGTHISLLFYTWILSFDAFSFSSLRKYLLG